MRKKPKFRELDLFGDPIEAPPRSNEIIPLDFETHAVRVIVIKGDPWWVLADVSRVLGYASAQTADRILRGKEKGKHRMLTLGGDQEVVIVNEPGLYRLIMRSNKPEAERFQDWVVEEVLPSIRRTGRYDVRTAKLQRKYHGDRKRAEFRIKQIDKNKSIDARMSTKGACRNDHKRYHNSIHMGLTGRDCSELREFASLKRWQSPLDHMSSLALSQNLYAKELTERRIESSPKPLTFEDESNIGKGLASQIARTSFKQLGRGSHYGVIEDRKGGSIIDIIPGKITSS